MPSSHPPIHQIAHNFFIKIRHISICVWVLGLLISMTSPSWGQDGNYQDYIMGQRAAGMGGAFTAIANDPSAGFYNPAGFATQERLQVGMAINLQALEYRQLESGLLRPEGQLDLERWEFVLRPSSVGVAARFGPRDQFGTPMIGGGFTIVIPYLNQIRFRSALSSFMGSELRRSTIFMQRDDQTLMAGPSLSLRLGPLAIGITGFYTHRSFAWSLSNNAAFSKCQPTSLQNCDLFNASNVLSNVEGWVGQLNFRLGILAQLNPRWRLGFMASLSSLRLWGNGSFFIHQFALSRDEENKPTEQFTQRSGLKVRSPLPWSFRLGVAAEPSQNHTFAFDLSIYLPQKYQLLELPTIQRIFHYPNQIHNHLVINLHLGGEHRLTPKIPFRWGLFTNFSSAPDIPDNTSEPHLAQIHMFGATTSIGLYFWGISFDLGLAASYGQGMAQRYQLDKLPEYESVRMRQFFFQIYLAGATEILGRSLEELWKRVSKHPLLEKVSGSQPTSKPTTQLVPPSAPSSQPKP
jgi:long-chain fatty acid transport protein